MSFLQYVNPRSGVIAIVICNGSDYKYSSNSNRWNITQCNSNRKQCNRNLAITFILQMKISITLKFNFNRLLST